MDLSVRTETYGQGDMSWLGSAHGTQSTRSITLDTSTFTAATHYPDGYFPSGLALGQIDTTGLFGPVDSAAVDGRANLAGFLFGDVKAPSSTTVDVQGALFDHGRVIVNKLPVAVDDTQQGTNGHFIYA